MLELSLHSNMKLDEIEQLPISVLHEYMALNTLSPFTNDAQAQRDGIMISLMANQNVTKKKNLRSATDFLPYLKGGVPEWAEDEMVLKAKKLFKEVESHALGGQEQYNKSKQTIKVAIQEQIDMELLKDNVDRLRVDGLRKLIK